MKHRKIVRATTRSLGLFIMVAALPAELACQKQPQQTLMTHVQYLASDELGGRGIGTFEIDLAADYIADQFRAAGIEPAGENGSYFQDFSIRTGVKMDDTATLSITGLDAQPKLGEDYLPLNISGGDPFDGEVIFCGYGIVDERSGRNDYAGLDVDGRVVMLIRGTPESFEGRGRTRMRHAALTTKASVARDHGAVAVIMVNQVPDSGEVDELREFSERVRSSADVPFYHLTRKLGDRMLLAGGAFPLDMMEEMLEDSDEVVSMELLGMRVSGTAGVQPVMTTMKNVAGVIQGEGPLADEYVVIGGHYDHLGTDTASDGTKIIYNGADDNASGTAGVIEIGRRLAESAPHPRSVLLITFSGEESGLLGSRHYAKEPLVPLDKTVAMLNMDMIGRLDEQGELNVYGTKTAAEFQTIIAGIDESMISVTVKGQDAGSGRSDDAPFYREKVPAMHFITTLHEDYHQPTDDVEFVNEPGMEEVAEFVHAVAAQILEMPERPTYQEVSGRGQIPRIPGAYIGVFPSGAGPDGGLIAARVMPDGPAEEGGMKDGDIIMEIEGTRMEPATGLRGSLRGKKPGDTVKVLVMRDGRPKELSVTLGERPQR